MMGATIPKPPKDNVPPRMMRERGETRGREPVPHGVEHCPVALDEKACEVLLIDPAGTNNAVT